MLSYLPLILSFQGGFYLFSIADSYAGGFPRLFTGLFELIAVIWIYGTFYIFTSKMNPQNRTDLQWIIN